MKGKTKQILFALIALVIVFVGIFGYRYIHADRSQKNITIRVVVEDEVIYTQTVETKTATLAELLKEMAENQEIQIVYENSSYGMYIKAMGTQDVYYEDPSKNKYWTYDSENNAQCAKTNFCDSADNLLIGDGDVFVFELTTLDS